MTSGPRNSSRSFAVRLEVGVGERPRHAVVARRAALVEQHHGREVEAQLEGARRERAQVRRLVARGPRRVLHRREAVGRGLVHVLQQALVDVLLAPRRNVPRDEALRGLLQLARRLAVVVLHDAPVRRVGRIPRDAGNRQRLRVGEPHVPVPLPHVDGPVGDHRVEEPLVGHPVGERRVAPSAAGDPRQVGVRLREGGERVLERLERVEAVEAHGVDRRPREVQVRVLEAGHHQPPLQIDDGGVGPGEGADVRRRSHGDDSIAADGERLGGRAGGVGRPDLPVDEDAIGVLGQCRRRGAYDQRRGEGEGRPRLRHGRPSSSSHGVAQVHTGWHRVTPGGAYWRPRRVTRYTAKVPSQCPPS